MSRKVSFLIKDYYLYWKLNVFISLFFAIVGEFRGLSSLVL